MHFHSLKVVDIVRETPEAITLYFEKPRDEVFNYLPGHYLTLKVHVNGQDERRAYSLCTSPFSDTKLGVTVKKVEGGLVSGFLNDHLTVGQSIEVLSPRGNFKLETDPSIARHIVLIGGGSGITPLMSMLKAVLEKEPKSRVSLLYFNRNLENIIFKAVLDRLEASSEGRLRVLHSLDHPPANWTGLSGVPDKLKFLQLVQDLLNMSDLPASFYMCGPGPMMEAAEQALGFVGIAKNQIHRELFTAPQPKEKPVENLTPATESDGVVKKRGSYEVKIILDGKEKTVTIPEDKTVLEVALQNGIDPPYACQMGICTTCRAKVKAGHFEMDESEGLSDTEIEQGYILTCQSHPLTPDCIIEYG